MNKFLRGDFHFTNLSCAGRGYDPDIPAPALWAMSPSTASSPTGGGKLVSGIWLSCL